jgi:hypothetical protein
MYNYAMKTKVAFSLTLSVIITLCAFSQTASKPEAKLSIPTPVAEISESLRSRVAIAQRNYLAAQTQMQNASKEMQDVFAETGPICDKAGKLFDPATIACVAKPVPPPSK